jgi:PAS domain S-box-containing protein
MMDGFAYCRVVFDSAGKAVNYVFLEVNSAFERLTGLKRVDILGKTVTDALLGTGKDPCEWIRVGEKATTTGKPAKFEACDTATGKWFSVSGFSLKKGYLVAIFEDITERRKLETSLRESERRLKRSQEIAHLGSWELDLVTRKLTWSDEVYRIFGLKPQAFEATYDAFLAAVYPDDRKKVDAAYCGSLSDDGNVYEVLHRIVRNDTGEVRYVHEKCEHIRDASGVVVRSVGMVHDVTEQKKAEQKLADSLKRERFLADLVRKTSVAVGVAYPDGRLGLVNSAFQELTGYSAQELKDIRWTDVLTPPEWWELEAQKLAQLQQTKTPVKYEKEYLRKDGSRVPIELVVHPFFDEAGRVTHYFGFITDITQRKKAEADLRESEVKYRTVADFNYDWEYWIAPDGKFVYVSPSCERITGYRADEFLQDPELFTKIILSQDKTKLGDHFDLLESGTPHELDFRIVTRDECIRWISHDCQTVYDDKGKWLGRRASNRDITERKHSEEALLKLNRHLRAISNSTQALMYAKTEEAYANKICDILINDCGYVLVWVGFAENNEAKTVRPIAYSGFDKEYIDELNVSWSRDTLRGRGPAGIVIRTGKPYVCRNLLEDPCFEPWRTNASCRGYKASISLPLTSFEGVTFGVLSIYSRTVDLFSDEEMTLLTELAHDFAYGIAVIRLRKERERTYELMRRQAALIDLNPNAIITRKIDGTITFWNRGAETLYGWTRKEAVGNNINLLLKTKLPQSLQSIIEAINLYKHWSGEILHYAKDGRELVMQSYWLAKFNQNGEISELIESNVDVTDRKQMQIKLEEYSAHLEELVHDRTIQLRDAERLTAIGETAGMVGHDLRNPLQTVIGEAFLAKEEVKHLPDSPTRRNLEENIGIIAEQIGYMDKIVSDLQDFVRPIIPDKKSVNLSKLLIASLDQINLPNNVKVQTNISENIPPVMVDSQLLKRVFFNLFTNAVQAMPNGGKITINAFVKKNDKGKNRVQLEVEDTGEGIPESIKPKIFRPLFTTKSKGQGFGLAVCRRVIEAHGGIILFDSQEGRGTRFIVELPA